MRTIDSIVNELEQTNFAKETIYIAVKQKLLEEIKNNLPEKYKDYDFRGIADTSKKDYFIAIKF